MELFIYAMMASVGLTYIVTEGAIFGGMRKWLIDKSEESSQWETIADLFTCGQCFGFWAGMCMQTLFAALDGPTFLGEGNAWLSTLVLGLSTSGTCVIIRKLSER